MWITTAGIRTSTTTDWLPNAGTAPSSDRTTPGRTSPFFAADRILQVALGVLDRRGRVGRARLFVTGDDHCRVAALDQLATLNPSHRQHRVYQHRVVLAEDQSRRDRVKAQ